MCHNGFSFKLPTLIYGNQIDDYLIEELTDANNIKEGIDFDIVGIITNAELKAIKDCVQNSNSVKNRVKKLLFS